jgi:hypothetical protein
MKRLLAVILLLSAGAATAAPVDPAANQHLQAGLAHFTKKAYDAAIDEFKAGWAIEQDIDILYAWAQAERMRGNCPGAIKLYKQYLNLGSLTAAQQKAGQVNLERCQKALAGEQPEPDKQPDKQPALIEKPVAPPAADTPWYTDPLGDALVVVGVAGLAFGTVEMLSSTSEEDAATGATTYQDYKDHIESAQSKRTLAYVGLSAGAALVVGGIIRYATRSHGHPTTESSGVAASAWLAPGGGGVVLGGRF